MGSTVKILMVLTVGVCLSAIVFNWIQTRYQQRRLATVREGLLNFEKQVSLAGIRRKVAIGFGVCWDVFLNATAVLHKLNLTYSDTLEQFDVIRSLSELERSFNYFFSDGAAAERYVENSSIIQDELAPLFSDNNLFIKDALGGNAPIMGNRFAKHWDVLLGANMSENGLKSLHQNIQATGTTERADDFHVILEYRTGDKWGELTAPRANRFIVHSDKSYPDVGLIKEFANGVKDFQPDLIVISGLQMIDTIPFKVGELEELNDTLQTFLSSVPSDVLTHFEMASFTNKRLLHDFIIPGVYQADSIGCNEQELENLLSILSGGAVTYSVNAYPRLASVLDKMRDVWKFRNKHLEHASKSAVPIDRFRALTRLHVHTVAYQVIFSVAEKEIDESGARAVWKNARAAAAHAALVANRHTCGLEEIDLSNAYLLMDESFARTATSDSTNEDRVYVDDRWPVSCWQEDQLGVPNAEQFVVQACVSPVLVCARTLQTAGGGDNISVAGLMHQLAQSRGNTENT